MNAANEAARARLLGLGLGLFCVLVWSGYVVIARYSAGGLLQGPEQASLRIMGAGLFFLPRFILARRRLVAQHGWRRLLLLTLATGPSYTMLFVTGLVFAPVAHGGVITPAAVAVATTLLAWWWLGEVPQPARIAGLGLVVLGVGVVGWDGIAGANPGAWRGLPFFLSAATLWAAFSVLIRRWNVAGLDAVTIISVLSLPFVPVHALWRGERFLEAAWPELLMQFVMQGVLTGVLVNVAFARTVWLLGPARAGAISALVPVLATVLGWALLREPLSILQLAGMAIAVTGVLAVVLIPSRRLA
jgi:drug/metabolite transporter (DMT)-like permease